MERPTPPTDADAERLTDADTERLTDAGAERLRQLEARVEGLEVELSLDRERLHAAAATIRAREADLSAQAAELARVRRASRQFQRRRSVRAATMLSARMRLLLERARRLTAWPRRARRRIQERVDERRRRASAAAERALVERIRGASAPALTTGPLVSIVILNRDGRQHLERCLEAVAQTAYRDVEIIVVDNGSTDGSAELAERKSMPFPLTVIRNAENRTFSEANAQGVEAAAGELICFLNNDTDPITEHWLGYLVETSRMPGAVAVGARLIYPRHRGGTRGGEHLADLTLQHRGVSFDRTMPVPIPRPMGAGEDPLAPVAVGVAERPALTAACLLMKRDAFEAVGGFSTEYDYGLEDVDLCLKLRAAGGRLIYDGRAALWHHESATRAVDVDLRRARVEHNREAYVDAWGPRVFREALLEALIGDDRDSGRSLPRRDHAHQPGSRGRLRRLVHGTRARRCPAGARLAGELPRAPSGWLVQPSAYGRGHHRAARRLRHPTPAPWPGDLGLDPKLAGALDGPRVVR